MVILVHNDKTAEGSALLVAEKKEPELSAASVTSSQQQQATTSLPKRFFLSKTLSWRNSKRDLITKKMNNQNNKDSCGDHDDGDNDHVEEEEEKQKQAQLRQRHVHFSDQELPSRTYIIEEDNSNTNKQSTDEDMIRSQYWYHEEDYKRFEKDRILTSLGYGARHRVTFDDSIHTIRGLEGMCDIKLNKRVLNERRHLYQEIKEEQARQINDGRFPDMNKFRSLSLKHSRPSADRAIRFGQDDALVVLREENRNSRKPFTGRNPKLMAETLAITARRATAKAGFIARPNLLTMKGRKTNSLRNILSWGGGSGSGGDGGSLGSDSDSVDGGTSTPTSTSIKYNRSSDDRENGKEQHQVPTTSPEPEPQQQKQRQQHQQQRKERRRSIA